ncbi:MAG TPA: hypothetical protein VIK57_15780 [Streptosporangiaceae bacterium]
MTVRPDFGSEYGDEERQRFEEHDLPGPEVAEEEREIREHEREDEEVEFLEPEENEAHAPGQVCERCGQTITDGQDARRRLDGQWVHEECPPNLAGLTPEG